MEAEHKHNDGNQASMDASMETLYLIMVTT